MGRPTPAPSCPSVHAEQHQTSGLHDAPQWLDREAEAFEGRHAEQRSVASFSEDQGGHADPILDLEEGCTNLADDGAAIGKTEPLLGVGLDADLAQETAGRDRVARARVDDQDLLEAAAAI